MDLRRRRLRRGCRHQRQHWCWRLRQRRRQIPKRTFLISKMTLLSVHQLTVHQMPSCAPTRTFWYLKCPFWNLHCAFWYLKRLVWYLTSHFWYPSLCSKHLFSYVKRRWISAVQYHAFLPAFYFSLTVKYTYIVNDESYFFPDPRVRYC